MIWVIVAVALFVALAFATCAAYARLYDEDDEPIQLDLHQPRTGRDDFTGFHREPSRYVPGHPPEQPPHLGP